MKRIAIFTTFHKVDLQYSVCASTLELCKILVEYGYDVKLLVLTNFPKEDVLEIPQGVELQPVIPVHTWVDYVNPCQKKHETFDQEVEEVTQALIHALTDEQGNLDIDIVITEDIIFQGWFVLHNATIREVARAFPELKWIHWTHSSPSARPQKLCYPTELRYRGMPNSLYVSMNYTNVPKLAQMYNVPEGLVRVVYNIRDPMEFLNMHPLSKEIIKKHKLLDVDVLIVYPMRMNSAKQPEKIVKIAGQMKQKGKNVKVVFCDSYSNNPTSQDLMTSVSNTGEQWGLDKMRDIIYTSRLHPSFELGVPNDIIRDLLLISNVFIHPSMNEGCSLVMLEAALTKNLVILNDDLYSMHEFGKDDVYYISFGSEERRITGFVGGESKFYEERAQIILEMLETNKVLSFNRRILKRFHAEWIFKNQIEPMLYA